MGDEHRQERRRSEDRELFYRVTLLEDAVKKAAHNLTLEQVNLLDFRYMTRSELESEFIPRDEHREFVKELKDAKAESRDWLLRIVLALLAAGQFAQAFLH